MKPSALNTVGGALIATWLAVNPANALAEEQKPITNPGGTQVAAVIPVSHPKVNTPPVPQLQVSVPMLDRRLNGVRATQATGVARSEDAVVVVFYGKDRNLFNDTKEASREAIIEGRPVRWMVFGPPTDESYVEVFANQQLLTKEPGLTNKEDVLRVIAFADDNVVKTGLFASLPKAEPQ